MKPFMFIAFAVAVLCCPVSAQQVSREYREKTSELRIQYNKIEDSTNVSTKQQSVEGAGFSVAFYFNHKGPHLKESVKAIGLVVDSASRDWKFLKDHNLRLFVLADGQRFNVTGVRYDSSVHAGAWRSVSVSERLIFSLTIDQLKMLVAATSVEAQLANETFRFSDKTLKGVQQIISLIESNDVQQPG